MKHTMIRFAVAVLFAFSIAACQGPRPVVVQQELRAPDNDRDPYMLFVTVNNQGTGEGQAEITARLRDKSTGNTVAQGDQTVDLQANETVQLALPLQTATRGDYDVVVDVQYPPQ